MSLIFIDSFKNYSFLPMKWDERTTMCQFYLKSGIGRKAGQALAISRGYKAQETDFLGKNLGGNFETLILGFAMKRLTYSGDFLEIWFCDGTSAQSKILLYGTGISWYSGSSSSNYGRYFAFDLNRWYYIEIKIKASDILGELVIRVDENIVLSLDNLDTITTSNLYFNRIRFNAKLSSISSSDFAYIDDLYVVNDLGTFNNNFLGNCEISIALPSGQGNYSDFLPSPSYSGSVNYTLINDPIYQQDNTVNYNNIFYEYAGADDGCYIQNTNEINWVFNNSSTLVAHDSIYMNSGNGGTNSHFWFRFSSVSIPKNAKIIQAYIIANRYDTPIQPTTNQLQIYFQKLGSPAPQVASSSDFYARSFTYNTYTGAYGDNISNKNISSSLQELVDLPDWQEENNSVLAVVKIKYTSTSIGGVWSRYTSYEANNNPYHAQSPKLFVEWQLPDDDSDKYLKSDSYNDVDTYSMTTTSGLSNILAVNYCAATKRELDLDETNDVFLQATMVSGGSTYLSTTILPNSSRYLFTPMIVEKDPCTNLPWVYDSIVNNYFGFTTISG
jgi:hypothetical protein